MMPRGERAPLEISNATQIYRKNKVGVQFAATYHNVSSDERAVATIGISCNSNRLDPQERLVHAKHAQYILRQAHRASAGIRRRRG